MPFLSSEAACRAVGDGNWLFIKIARPTDLKSLCLVSKAFSQISTPFLYRDLELPYDQGDTNWSKLKSLANKEGIQYVKSLKFGLCDYTEFSFCKALEDLLPRLRKDSLKRFEFGGLGRPTHDMMKHLWHSQKSLRNLQLNFGLLSPSIDDILREDAPALKALDKVDELDVNFAATVDADSAHDLLCFLELRNLQKIQVTFVPSINREVSFRDPFFAHHLPISLTHITLNFISLPRPEFLQFDLYPSLTYLELHDCLHTGPVMDAFRKPVLRQFSYLHSDTNAPLDELALMLRRFNTLENLIVDIGLQAQPYDCDMLTLGIVTHCETLKSLLFYIPSQRSSDRAQILLRTATGCRRLRQLALEFDYQTIVTFCKTVLFDKLSGLSALSVLNVLNVAGLQNLPDGFFESQHPDWNMLHMKNVERVADEIFGHRSAPNPLVLAFGRKFTYTNKLEKQEDRNPPKLCFIRSEPRDPKAPEMVRTKAILIEWNLAKYVVPECDLLDYEFDYASRSTFSV